MCAAQDRANAAAEIERTAHRLFALVGKQVAGERFRATWGDVQRALAQAKLIEQGRELPLMDGANLAPAGAGEYAAAPRVNGEVINLQIEPELIDRINFEWKQYDDPPGKAEMGRILMNEALEARTKARAKKAGKAS